MSTATQRASNLFVGSPIERLEDLRFLTGRGQYVDDLHSERMLHAAILRSPRLIRLLIVPSGALSSEAISVCVLPS